jgi:hypothetical protein
MTAPTELSYPLAATSLAGRLFPDDKIVGSELIS